LRLPYYDHKLSVIRKFSFMLAANFGLVTV
ncbi:MAG: hypothetical protein ACI82O_004476, partial [Patiriisocius sp.]